MFKIILNFLRSNYLEELSSKDLKKLQVEAEHFEIASLQQIIQQRLNVLTFSINFNTQKRLMSLKRSLFGNIPLPNVVELLNEVASYPKSIHDWIILAESETQECFAKDRDGNILIQPNNLEQHNNILNALYELKNRSYDSDLCKAFVYLRDYHLTYSAQSEITIKVGNLELTRDKSVLRYGSIDMIHSNGEIVAKKLPELCSNGGKLCQNRNCERSHDKTLEELVLRVLMKLQHKKVGKEEPDSKKELESKKDSKAAHAMGLLTTDTWFIQ